MAIRIGCGSWGDQEYVGVLYPPGTPASRRLPVYATRFDHVEVNSGYYSVPRRQVVENWVRQTPASFTFDFKLHRNLLSSVTRTAAAREAGKMRDSAAKKDLLVYTLEELEPMLVAGKLGTFLLLLPPRFAPEKHQLAELDLVAEQIAPHPLAIEFRDSGWVRGKHKASTLAYFRERKIAWVEVDMPRLKDRTLMPAVDEVTNPALAYLRLHGRNPLYLEAESAAARHTYLYEEKELKEIVTRIKRLADHAEDVHVIANNHARDYAPRTALRLRELLGQTEAATWR